MVCSYIILKGTVYSHLCRSIYLAIYIWKKQQHCPAGLSMCAAQVRLLLCNPCRSSCHSYCRPPEHTKQCSQTCPPKIKKRQHGTPLFKQLHWLPIQTRIDYKLATPTFRHFDGSLPQYISSRLDIYQKSRLLRSSDCRLHRIPRWELKSFGYRSFSYQGPVVWILFPLISTSHLTWPPLNPK